MMKKTIFYIFLFALIIPAPSFAFNPNYVLADVELEDYNSMTLDEIKTFLAENGSFLSYYADFYPGTWQFMEAPEIIWNTAQNFHINPQFILTLLEKEQSLVTLKKPSQKRLDWAMGYSVCDRCRLDHPLLTQYKGFAKQVYHAAERIRNIYLQDLAEKGKTQTKIGPGIKKKIDKKYVTPVNNATAILYTYTPHIKGNESFYKLWTKWFTNVSYPDGSLLKDPANGGIYLIQDGKKRPFTSKEAFFSRYPSDKNVLPVSKYVLARYETGLPIRFENFSLLRDENKTVYLSVDEEIRPFESLAVFKSFGFSQSDIKDAAPADLASYTRGEPIVKKNAYLTGALLQDKETGGVFWMYDGKKYPITDRAVLAARFGKKPQITKVNAKDLTKYEKGAPVKFLNGELLRSTGDSTVYFLSAGKLRPVPSEEIFLAHGWRWENVIQTSDKVIALYEIGEPIRLDIGEKPANAPSEIIATDAPQEATTDNTQGELAASI